MKSVFDELKDSNQQIYAFFNDALYFKSSFWLTHTVTHTRKGLKSAGRKVCASRPAFFSLPYMTCAMKLPMVAAASSCFCRVAWV